MSQQIQVVRSAWTESSWRIHSYFVLNARGQKVQKKGRSFWGSPALFTPLMAWRGDSFHAIRRLPRRRSRPKDEVLLRLPLEDTVYVVGAVPSEEAIEVMTEPLRPCLDSDHPLFGMLSLRDSTSTAACTADSSTASSWYDCARYTARGGCGS